MHIPHNTPGIGILLLSLFLSAPAAANIAAPQTNPSSASAPSRLGAESIQVTAERLRFDCAEIDGQPQCDFQAVYTFENKGAAPASTPAAFYGLRIEQIEIRKGDRSLASELSEAQQKALDEAAEGSFHKERASVNALRSYQHDRAHQDKLSRQGFHLSLPAGGKAEVTVTGRMRPGFNFKPSFTQSAVFARHVWLGSDVEAKTYDFEYLIAPIRTWGHAPLIDVRLSYPADWEPWTAVDPSDGMMKRKQDSAASGRACLRFSVSGNKVDSFRFGFHRPEAWLFHGGPLLGIGGNLDDSGGFRMRFGYEVAAPSWLLWSLNFDTDFDEELVIAPMAEAALPGLIYLFPSAGLGLGVPLRVKPDFEAGIRVQVTLQWVLIGLVTSFDIYPGLDSSHPLMFQASMMGQIAF